MVGGVGTNGNMICASSGSPVSIKVCCSQSSPKLRTNLRGSTGQHCSTYTITHCQQLQSLLTSSPSRTFTTFSRMKPMFESILTAARITLACPRSAGPCEEPMTNAAEAEQPTLRCPNAYHHPCPLAVHITLTITILLQDPSSGNGHSQKRLRGDTRVVHVVRHSKGVIGTEYC